MIAYRKERGNLQLVPPDWRVCLGGAGRLRTTSWASCDRWTITSLSFTAVCIRRTLSASGPGSESFLPNSPILSDLPVDVVVELSAVRRWLVGSDGVGVGLGGGPSTDTVGMIIGVLVAGSTAADDLVVLSSASSFSLSHVGEEGFSLSAGGGADADGSSDFMSNLTSFNPLPLASISTVWQVPSSWNLTLALLPERPLIEWRCWSATAWTYMQ